MLLFIYLFIFVFLLSFGIYPLRKCDHPDNSFMKEYKACIHKHTHTNTRARILLYISVRRDGTTTTTVTGEALSKSSHVDYFANSISLESREARRRYSYTMGRSATVQVCCDFRWADMVNGKLVV